jgi:acyl-CoA synthetase (AMP-forming)/AMP-acid ligase II
MRMFRLASCPRLHDMEWCFLYQVVDDKGQVVPIGTQGELETKGYGVMAGYWNDEVKTREVWQVRALFCLHSLACLCLYACWCSPL